MAARKSSSGRKKKNTRQRQQVKDFIAKAAATAPPPKEQAPAGFVHAYGPGVLADYGPLILAYWTVPTVVEDYLRKQGATVPDPVHGALLLDTGATGTCISIKAADALGLQATRMAPGFGSGGDTLNPVFQAKLHIPMANPGGVTRVIMREDEVQGIPKLEEHFKRNPLAYSGAQIELIGLLGRDVLAATRFTYDGLVGTLRLDFDLKAMGLA